MKNADDKIVAMFDGDRAATYDERALQTPWRQLLDTSTLQLLTELPEEAHILCVGCGTGLELVPLAHAHPGWRFTAVEPAGAMLAVCRQRAEREGFAARCTFHEGYLESLPAAQPFDAALCLLVSHFMTDRAVRVGFFSQIASRLAPNAPFIDCDLASDKTSYQYPRLLDLWRRALASTGHPMQEIEHFTAAYDSMVAMVPPSEVERCLVEGGFSEPTLFLQAILVHAWSARRA